MEYLLSVADVHPLFFIPIELAVAFSCALLIIYVKNKIFNWLIKQFEATNNIWDESIIQAVIWPSTNLVLFMLAFYSIEIMSPLLPDRKLYETILADIKTIGTVIIIASFLIQLVKSIEYNYFKMIDLDSTLETASSYIIGKMVKLTIVILTIFVILKSQRQDFLALLTVGGAGSLILGLAAKDMLSNFFGGLTIYLDKPFKVGDLVVTTDHQLEGVVEKIGWRSTRIRTFEKRPVSVPNNIWSNIPVENASRINSRRFRCIIGLRYQDAKKLKTILEAIKNEIKNDADNVDQNQIQIVQLDEFAQSSLNLLILFYIKTTNINEYLNIRQEFMFKLIEIIHAHAADFAFQTATVDISDRTIAQLNNPKSLQP